MAGLAGELLRRPSGVPLNPLEATCGGTLSHHKEAILGSLRGRASGFTVLLSSTWGTKRKEGAWDQAFELGPLRQLAVKQRKTNDRRVGKVKTELAV